MVEKKRVAPAKVQPVSHGGVRYEALHWGKARDLDQNGGYVVAIDEATDDEKWIVKVYDVVYAERMEDDKQDVFITRLSLRARSNQLLVENERGERYTVDLTTRAVAPAPR